MRGILLVPELGCAYRWSDEYRQLEWCPVFRNRILGDDEWGLVEEELVGEEMVDFRGNNVTLSEVYRAVERILK